MKNSLRIEGSVMTSLELGFDDLSRVPAQIDDIGKLISGRQGQGVPLQSLLKMVGVTPQATHLTLASSDGRFSASVPLAAVDEAFVAYRLGNDPLPESLGGPFRFYIPNVEECAVGGIDACANVKFLGLIRLTSGAGIDTRPTTKSEHEELHRHQD